MASLINTWDGWKYYDDGTVISPANEYYYQGDKVWSPSVDAPAASSWADGWGSTLQGLAGTVVNTWSASTLMQQNAQGRRYIEGQPYIYGQQSSGMSGLLLLAAGAALIFALAK